MVNLSSSDEDTVGTEDDPGIVCGQFWDQGTEKGRLQVS